MLVRELMNPYVVTVEPESSAALAARLLSRNNVGLLPVCRGEDRKLLGVLTDRDIVLRCVSAGLDPEETAVETVMTRFPVSVSPGEECGRAADLMAQKQVRRLPVTEGGKLLGLLSLGDLSRCGRYDMEAAQALSEITENVVRR